MTTQAKEDRIEDVSVDSLIFRGAKKKLTTQVAENVADATIEETMSGAADLTVELRDHKYVALNSGLFDNRFFCQLDGAPYRYTELSLVSQYLLRVSFEHALIAEMREHTGPLKMKRGSVTRAEFIHAMLKELKGSYRFICPELHRTQKTPAPEQIKESHEVATGGQSATSSLADAERGPSLDHSGLTVKHQPMTASQAKVLTEALEGGTSQTSNVLALESLVTAIIQEATASNPPGGDADSKGALQVRQSTANGIQKADGAGYLDPMNVSEVSAKYVSRGYWGKGGADALAKAHPSWTAGQVAQQVQGSAFPQAYDQWDSEAKAIVAAFGGGGLGGSDLPAGVEGTTSVTTMRTAEYEFSRGTPGEPEDTFTCATRLAEKVGWHFFIVGAKDIYFVNDNDLLRAAPRYTITPDSIGPTDDVTFDHEVGNRRVIEGGRRVLKSSEGEIKVRLDRYAAPPGTVVALEGYGPADGKWLVDSVSRSLYDAQTTIHIRTPQKPLEEPKATASTEEEPGTAGTGELASEGGAGTTASRAVEKKLSAEHPELQAGVRKVVAAILTQFPEMSITSTTGGTHAPNSMHYSGRAADLAGGNMDAIGTWIAKNLTAQLTEGIHAPTLSVKNGVAVPSSYWGSATWAEHINHVHVSV